MERIRQELNPHYDDVHQKVYQVRDAFKGEIPSKEEFVKYFWDISTNKVNKSDEFQV